MKLWAGRFQKETDTLVNDFNSSITFDARLYQEDIEGSMAHAAMLGKQGIIEEHEAEKIIDGLKAILEDIKAERVELTTDNEDIHMNVESLLTGRLGETGKRLHTARSRNDQVAVDFRLFVKREIPTIIRMCLDPAGGLPGAHGRVPPGRRRPGHLHLPGGPVPDRRRPGLPKAHRQLHGFRLRPGLCH